jgi:imidazolonepropionase-like amidohydrolase
VERQASGGLLFAVRPVLHNSVHAPNDAITIAATGGYFPARLSPEMADLPRGAQLITGSDEARRTVREQIYNGADLIKVYADFLDMASPNTMKFNHPTLTIEEMRTVVEEAHKGGHRVAAHAMTGDGARNAVEAGVDSIEHGSDLDHETLARMAKGGVVLVPTSAAQFHSLATAKGPERDELNARFETFRKELADARQLQVKIATGFDAADADDQGKDMDELLMLAKLGFTLGVSESPTRPFRMKGLERKNETT